ncbi:hypothetical protein DFH06DRAFT_1236735 [Mycena polygramma]|nr:hypothetical protein DFH06DRAFT_1236735 [Mycena polygramma]
MTSIPPSLYTSRSRSSLSAHSVADTVTSTAPLTAAYRPPPKDYAAAFASLQGQYGMSGDFPVHASAPVKKKPRKPPPRSGSPAGPCTPTPAAGPKNASSQRRARIPDPPIAATRRTSSDSERVRAPAETSSAMPAGDNEDTAMEGKEGDKGKPSGLSRLKKLFRLGRKETRES